MTDTRECGWNGCILPHNPGAHAAPAPVMATITDSEMIHDSAALVDGLTRHAALYWDVDTDEFRDRVEAIRGAAWVEGSDHAICERDVEGERRYNALAAELLTERQRLDRVRQAWDNQGNWYFNLMEAATTFLTVWFSKGYVTSDEHVAEAAKAIPALREAVAKVRDIDIPDAVAPRKCSKCGGFQFREWPHWVGGCPRVTE